MICSSGGLETGTNLGERAGNVKTGARDKLTGTLGYGSTRRVGAVVAGTRATVGVIAVVNRRKRSVSARIVSLPTVAKGGSVALLESASARFLAARVATSTEDGAGMTYCCRKNFMVLATRSARVFGT